jgi:HSP20 family protein
MALGMFNTKKDTDNMNNFVSNIVIDLLEDDDYYYVYAEFAGREKEEIKIKFQGENLLLKICDDESDYDDQKGYLIEERYRQEKERLIKFPEPIQKKGVDANYENGLLSVKIQKIDPESDDSDLIPIN